MEVPMFIRLIVLLAVLITMPVAAAELSLAKDAYDLGYLSGQYGELK
jgi:hypothetical protein